MDSAAYLFPGMEKWLLILPVLVRLYTSVIPLDPENNGLEVSWATDLSPTTIFYETCQGAAVASAAVAGEGVPGVGYGWVGWEGAIPGTTRLPSRDPYLD